uniref:Transmembrane protein n=1 Tax=Pithovirus LCPAC102 TaxID=2506587 RepID=A0A481Z6C5_9VIRU|nr:MAG: hypothetical protein LCPAC102_01230 [Pithovirus LCPAC102]
MVEYLIYDLRLSRDSIYNLILKSWKYLLCIQLLQSILFAIILIDTKLKIIYNIVEISIFLLMFIYVGYVNKYKDIINDIMISIYKLICIVILSDLMIGLTIILILYAISTTIEILFIWSIMIFISLWVVLVLYIIFMCTYNIYGDYDIVNNDDIIIYNSKSDIID